MVSHCRSNTVGGANSIGSNAVSDANCGCGYNTVGGANCGYGSNAVGGANCSYESNTKVGNYSGGDTKKAMGVDPNRVGITVKAAL